MLITRQCLFYVFSIAPIYFGAKSQGDAIIQLCPVFGRETGKYEPPAVTWVKGWSGVDLCHVCPYHSGYTTWLIQLYKFIHIVLIYIIVFVLLNLAINILNYNLLLFECFLHSTTTRYYEFNTYKFHDFNTQVIPYK